MPPSQCRRHSERAGDRRGRGLPLILVDANLLIYAEVSGMPEHEAARGWLDEQLSGRTGVGLPWPSLLAFLRITTNARIFEEPMSIEGAWIQVERWLDLRVTWIPEPTDRHRGILASIVPEIDRPEFVPDAHLAALAMEYGLILHSTDRDFARFSGLRWKNPLRP